MTTITKDFRFANSSGEETVLPIVFREDGYINMTKAAKAFGKKPIEFLRLPFTDEYVGAMADALKVGKSHLAFAKRGGRKGEAGTWCHPKLAVFFARWLDVRFAVWCDLMIDNILHGNIQTTVVVPTEEALKVSESDSERLGTSGGEAPIHYPLVYISICFCRKYPTTRGCIKPPPPRYLRGSLTPPHREPYHGTATHHRKHLRAFHLSRFPLPPRLRG